MLHYQDEKVKKLKAFLAKFGYTLKGDTSISCKKTFRLNRDKNCVLSIHTGNEEISIIRSDITYKDASFDSMNYELVFRFSKRTNYHFHEEIAIDFDNQNVLLPPFAHLQLFFPVHSIRTD